MTDYKNKRIKELKTEIAEINDRLHRISINDRTYEKYYVYAETMQQEANLLKARRDDCQVLIGMFLVHG